MLMPMPGARSMLLSMAWLDILTSPCLSRVRHRYPPARHLVRRSCLGNVRCAKDSCALPRCAKAAALPASAVCFQLTCSGQSLNGAEVEPCSAVWVDPDTKEVVVCGGEDEDETPDSGNDIRCVCCCARPRSHLVPSACMRADSSSPHPLLFCLAPPRSPPSIY